MNKNLFTRLSARLAASVCALTLVTATAHAQGFTPTWVESGLDKTVGASRPLSIDISRQQPKSLKQIPDDATNAIMGTFKTGIGLSVVKHALLLVMKEGAPATLYVDGNGDGTLAPDERHDWISTTRENADGSMTTTNYSCRATVQVTADGKRGELEFYLSRPGKTDAADGSPRVLFYHTGFGVTGEINLDGHIVKAAITDNTGSGQFSSVGEKMDIPLCWLNVTNTNKRGKVFLANRPVEIDGKWWVVTNLTAAGSFEMTPATSPVVKKVVAVAGPDLTPGKKAPVFTATLMDGKTVNFPADYKGKIVMVDFWATWCGPCMGEVPNVVTNYAKYHNQGFEILGVTLDKEDATAQINKVMEHKEMTWPQIYEGKFWDSTIAKIYGIHAIPHALLVDGDTGIILADNSIRGEALSPAIEKALATKKK